MKKNKFIVVISLFILLVVGNYIYQLINKKNITNIKENILEDLNSFKMDSNTKLMIIAHPDDDIIWGGSHLIDDNYLVVCITCGTDQTRVEEFKKVMDETGDNYIMLNFPDRTNGKRDNWDTVYDSITASLKTIIDYRDWDLIVTHNPDGEYGHIQHKMTNEIVTDLASKDSLMYFGHYYESNYVPTDLETIPDTNYKIKVNTLVPLYSSQAIIKPYGQMLNHEVWISYSSWGEDNE